ncbi:hypothetical protein M1247_31290 [Mycobacterium sp. 21AC1]|uniref:hypothetical protein n=1 Tax=[Mycobacterium] appelbergii TaxID=2939269 RepID=UPI002938DF77|nr:hypothetical protein [Mycobacterium sp. 21AC1]MDV3129427.1 hypothetical protein [Mycobacterium sp. 21AC1]
MSAIEWMLRVAGRNGLTPPLRDFAIALDKHSTFAKLTQSDAHHFAAVIVGDHLHHDNPAESLQHRLRTILSGQDSLTWEDPQSVYQAFAIAAQVAAINR